ncbi:heavy-metal-associated domain-containing protein [Treponema sp. Marseille-Q4132]|uniref:heavy-metal-associated domain-containing protein n=1 Tax=Treponema sp. Marseille-Q4132 TaxID=2766701 RepID=UPI001652C63D|nr:heavy metal-associated domain-containing protein [Treponema sp. Marseille-Q4132]QNL98317.1 heavy-metal-associated domain-containing protein [Treponema sp. Marseille-Q4132]
MAVNIIIILIIAVGVVFGVRSVLQSASGKSCCSGGDSIVKIEPSDTDRSHYPYRAEAAVEGMTCKNCAARVTNALNSLDGVWAAVNLKKNSVSVLLKEKGGEAALVEAVSKAGYTMKNVRITAV